MMSNSLRFKGQRVSSLSVLHNFCQKPALVCALNECHLGQKNLVLCLWRPVGVTHSQGLTRPCIPATLTCSLHTPDWKWSLNVLYNPQRLCTLF